MDGISPASFFLAANTAAGFYSAYEDLARPEAGDKIWYIKGGPGNGKSTFMRRAAAAAEAAGYHVEYILCSGDPDSLDGIYIRELKTAYVDATAPHVQEPSLPGVSGRYLDLSQFYKAADRLDTSELSVMYESYREQYALAYRFLSAAAQTDPSILLSAETKESLSAAGREFALGILPDGNDGSTVRRFISANSCLGFISLPGIAFTYGKVYLLPGDTANIWLSGAEEACKGKGLRVIFCPDPLDPEKLDALILPDACVSFLKAHKGVRYPKSTLRAAPLCEIEKSPEYMQLKRLQKSLLMQAYSHLKKAKEFHDALEALYRPAVDFKSIDRFTAKHIRENIS